VPLLPEAVRRRWLMRRSDRSALRKREGGSSDLITSASGVAGQGHSTAGSIFLLELGHIDLIGEGINVVMFTGAFHRPDTNRQSRCAQVRHHRSNLVRTIRRALTGQFMDLPRAPWRWGRLNWVPRFAAP
jgi:hypothetical protein